MPASPVPARYWADLSTIDFAQLDPATTVAVLPVAATEQHGPHLAVSVDADLVDGVIAAALAWLPPDLSVLFLPTQKVGYSPEHLCFPGTLSLQPDTLIQLWTDLGACVARAGVRKLVLFNGHGGQISMMDIVARELRHKHGLLVYSASWFSLPLGADVEALFPPEEHRFGIHAGDMETSMMLHLRPQVVRMDRAEHFLSTAQMRAERYPLLGNGRSAKFGWQIQDYNPAGAVGNAAAATADKGRALVESSARQLAVLLQEVSSLPLSTVATPVA